MKVGILAHKKTPENLMIYEEFLKNNVSIEFIDPLEIINGNENFNFDLILSRVERVFLNEGLYALTELQNNFKVINCAETVNLCQNKYLTYQKLKEVSPKSIMTYSKDFNTVFSNVKKLFGYPFVLKPIYGGYGEGVLKINSKHEFLNTFKELTKNNSEIFIQEYIEYLHDIRVFVINNEIIGAMERIPKNNWKANYSLGAEIKEIELSKDVKNMVLDSVKKVGADIVGVDVLVSKTKNYILEMNITPQFRGMMNFVNVSRKIVDYCMDLME
ncbi:alpha-L-glutamate ligase, RimK family [Methanococcus vannielii SB]|uniref:Alpha-L-glutamate ligase, RimK family n=1 Tax=Methanococcus vannielii (strain ATCC 35089 / DSM 1224 / JCM 13029 / OCM 148 / SB) TaxID=406327 RepID=A6UQP5_METVS|nr:RimK family alpha-L-glutamate ligase [Methanococcus vannielii]ABR54817.1 alpha-L-glutamate ligase, RimK family [Methanococcus vannielii SB]